MIVLCWQVAYPVYFPLFTTRTPILLGVAICPHKKTNNIIIHLSGTVAAKA